MTRRAPQSGAASWDAKTRTFRAVISAGAGVSRYDWDGEFIELLDPAGVELADNIPLLNAHRTFQAADVIGVTENVERIGDRLEAVLRLSKRAEVESIATDIRDAILSGVSIGYSVSEWKETTDDAGKRTKVATRWRLLEVSIVPIPADPGAKIRGKHIVSTNTDENNETQPKPKRAARAMSEMEIRAFAQEVKLPDAWVDEQIEGGVTKSQMHRAAVDWMAERQSQQPETQTMIGAYMGGHDFTNPEVRGQAMAEAIATRALPSVEPSAAARQFCGLSLVELARSSLEHAGVRTAGMGAAEVVKRSLGGLHSTSDFAVALSGAAGLVLRNAYEAAPSGLKPIARLVTLNDFRAKTFVTLSGMSALEKINEHGEFKRGIIKDSGESVKLDTFGRVFGITRQAIINDDIGFIADLPRKLGIAASQFEASMLADLLLSNPKMSDGKAVFHTDHGNLAAAGAAPSETTLSDARKAMRKQTDEAGQLIGVGPKYLVVGPELETDAEKLMATITATATDDVQPIRLSIAVEPRIADKSWFVAADPGVVDGLVYAHLASEPGPQIEHRVGFDVDGVEMRVRLDFGAAFIDWRSWYRNAGQ